jgi:hypothetical protein
MHPLISRFECYFFFQVLAANDFDKQSSHIITKELVLLLVANRSGVRLKQCFVAYCSLNIHCFENQKYYNAGCWLL